MQSVTYTIARPDSGAVQPYAVVTVFEQDGATRASLFDAEGAPQGNPITADANGAISFAAANGTYVLSAVSADGNLTLPNLTVQVFDLQALANAIAAGSLAGVVEEKYESQADRDADLTPPPGTIALVYADPDPMKNDLSYKIGAIGSAPWSAPLGLLAGLSYEQAKRASLQSYLASQPFANATELNAYTNAALALADRVIIPGDGSYEVTDLDPLTWTRDADSDGKRAEDAANVAGAAVGAVKQRAELVLQPDDGLTEGAWYGEFFAPVATNYTLLRARIYMGTGTCDLYVNVDDVNVAGPFGITTAGGTAGVTISATAGQRVSFQIDNISGTPGAIAVALEGLPA